MGVGITSKCESGASSVRIMSTASPCLPKMGRMRQLLGRPMLMALIVLGSIGGSVPNCFRVGSVLFVVAIWSALPALSIARTQSVAPPKRAHHELVYMTGKGNGCW